MPDVESDRRDPIAGSVAPDLDEWTFDSPEATNSPSASSPDGDARTEIAAEATLEGWEFGRTSDRTNRLTRSTGSPTASTLEERLAPLVGLLVVVSLVLSSGYLLAVTVW